MQVAELTSPIHMINLPDQYGQQKVEIDEAIVNVLQRGDFINGLEVREFENLLANYLHSPVVISCGNGTDALQLALMSLEIGKGCEVIIPAFGYISVAEVVVLLGATPVFVDIEKDYFFMDLDRVKAAITPFTKAIICVHLFGQTGNLAGLIEIAKQSNIFLIEDNAQSLGGSYQYENEAKFLGNLGNIGCTSFFPTKNLGCFGDGGAILTSDKGLEKKLRMIASHGQSVKYQHDLVGMNSRLDTLQAAILKVRLSYLTEQLVLKKSIFEKYTSGLKHLHYIILPKVNPNCNPAWHQFTIKVKNGKRNQLKAFLAERNVPSMVYYHIPLPAQTAYKTETYKIGDFPISEEVANEVLSLPIHSGLSDQQIKYIISCLKDFENE
jgi:UDP-2-acetamido-2-deoxy-ribo-hexuluronate aminotransferase